MVNFICKFGWAIVPSYFVKVYFDVSVQVFLDEINV